MNTYTSHFHGYFLPIFDCGAKLSFTSLTSINHTICNKYFLFNYQLKLIKYLYYKEDTDILFALCFNDPCIVRAAFFANIARIAASVTLFPSGALPKAPKALVTVFSWLVSKTSSSPNPSSGEALIIKSLMLDTLKFKEFLLRLSSPILFKEILGDLTMAIFEDRLRSPHGLFYQ